MPILITPEVGAALVGGALSLVQAAGSWISNRRQKKEERSAFESDRQWDLDRFLENREYQTSANQRKRLEDAGLSPYSSNISSGFDGNALQGGSGPAGSYNSLTSNLMTSAQKAFQTYLDRRDVSLNQQLRKQQLDLETARLDWLKEYQTGLLSNNVTRNSNAYELGKERNKIYSDSVRNNLFTNLLRTWSNRDIATENLNFKKDYYTNPNYKGYWDTKNSRQSYNFHSQYDPIVTGRASSDASLAFQKAMDYEEDHAQDGKLKDLLIGIRKGEKEFKELSAPVRLRILNRSARILGIKQFREGAAVGGEVIKAFEDLGASLAKSAL